MAPSTIARKDRSDERRTRQDPFKGPDRRRSSWSGYEARPSSSREAGGGDNRPSGTIFREPINPDAYAEDDSLGSTPTLMGAGTSISSGSHVNPSTRGTAEGPEDEENMYGNDATGPNLGADLDDLDDDSLMALENVNHNEEVDPTLPPLEDDNDERMFDIEDKDRR